VYAVDAKFNFDENAAFRQPEVFAMRDTTEEDPREVLSLSLRLCLCIIFSLSLFICL
jgi:succinyl-CoA synthetase beta subunit